jgi:isopentenyldiphosphate isomerase
LKDTIDRQARELGVKVEIISPFDSTFPVFINDKIDQDKTKQSCTHIYPVKIVSGEVEKEGEEFLETKWLSINEISKDIAYGHDLEILSTFNNFKRLS